MTKWYLTEGLGNEVNSTVQVEGDEVGWVHLEAAVWPYPPQGQSGSGFNHSSSAGSWNAGTKRLFQRVEHRFQTSTVSFRNSFPSFSFFFFHGIVLRKRYIHLLIMKPHMKHWYKKSYCNSLWVVIKVFLSSYFLWCTIIYWPPNKSGGYFSQCEKQLFHMDSCSMA